MPLTSSVSVAMFMFIIRPIAQTCNFRAAINFVFFLNNNNNNNNNNDNYNNNRNSN